MAGMRIPREDAAHQRAVLAGGQVEHGDFVRRTAHCSRSAAAHGHDHSPAVRQNVGPRVLQLSACRIELPDTLGCATALRDPHQGPDAQPVVIDESVRAPGDARRSDQRVGDADRSATGEGYHLDVAVDAVHERDTGSVRGYRRVDGPVRPGECRRVELVARPHEELGANFGIAHIDEP